jgi:type IX secretion system PorP/SprF family membrane protein
MNKITRILVALGVLASVQVKSQDFHLSMYDAAPMFTNPALTGLVDAPWRIHAQYRNQWKAVAFKPYNTALLSFDAPVKNWGLGAQIIEMRAGIGNYNVFQFMASAAYDIALDKNKYHQISMGVQAGFTQKSVDFGKLTFDNQYTTAGGGSFDKSISSNENVDQRSMILFQANAGFLYYFAKENSRLDPFLGYSVFNLTQPNESFFEEKNKLPIRHYVHGGVRINVNNKLFLIPKSILMFQTNAREQTYSLDVDYFLEKQNMFLLGGFTYRNKDAAIVYLGIRFQQYIAKVGYDVNTSSLKNVSRNRGAFEISFTYMGKKAKPQVIRNCPRL